MFADVSRFFADLSQFWPILTRFKPILAKEMLEFFDKIEAGKFTLTFLC